MEQVKDIWRWPAGIWATAGMSPASDEMQQAGSAGELPTLYAARIKASQGSGRSWRRRETTEILRECGEWQGQGQGLGDMAQEPRQHHARTRYLRRRVA